MLTSGASTYAYSSDTTDVPLKITRNETPYSQTAKVLIENYSNNLTSLALSGYQGVISRGFHTGVTRSAWAANTVYALTNVVIPTTPNGYQYRCTVAGTSHATTEPTWGTALGVTQTDGTVTWEMDGLAGDEYSPVAPLKVKAQELLNSNGTLVCQLDLIGLPDQLGMDKALTSYTQDENDENTVKALIIAIAGATLSPYTHCSAVTLSWDADDSLIGTFCPKDSFRVSVGESRLAKIKELIGYTKCVMRFQDDGKLHIFSPTVTGTTYNYEYKDDYVASSHPFFSKIYRIMLVIPSKYIVKNADNPSDVDEYYSGSATSAASYALLPKTEAKILRITSSAQGAAIAEALIQRAEQDHEKGSLYAPTNVGAEVHDYVKVTDNVEGDNRVGNIGYLSETYEPGKFDFMFGFGDILLQSSIGLGGLAAGEQPYVTYAAFTEELTRIYDNFDAIVGEGGLIDQLTTILEQMQNNYTYRKLVVTEQEKIPGVEL